MKLEDQNYVVGGVKNFTLSQFCRAMKTKESEIEVLFRNEKFIPEIKEFLIDIWNTIIPYSAKEIMKEPNLEKRRVLFSCLGAERLFKSLKPTLIDTQTISKKNKRWDKNGKEYIDEIEDTYSLYSISYSNMFPAESNMIGRRVLRDEKIFAVNCKCTTTGREYWIMVNEDAAKAQDAITAIAWTFRVNIEYDDIIEFYRQGDCFIVKTIESPRMYYPYKWKTSSPDFYHLTKEQYLNKLVSET